VVTSGWRDGPLESVYPPDIPIGRVTSHSIPASEAFQRVQIEPAVDLDSVSHVIVLIGGRLDREGQTATGLPGPGPAPGSGP
jgi:cell shape-determining protein MreC